MQPPEPPFQHLRWVDLVRAIGAFLVVLAHVQFQGPGPGWVELFYFVLSRIAVPMFFMASGYLLLGKAEPYPVFFRKRALKVLVPFLAWSVIYMLWKQEYFGEPFSLKVVAGYVVKILRGPRENHLWFFYALIGLYLFTPILRVFVARASRGDLLYFCGLWLLVTPVLYTLQEFTPLRFGFELYLVAGYTGYFMIGYLVGKLSFSRRHLYALTILFWLVCLASVAVIYLTGGSTQYFGDYISLNIVFLSVAAFILLRAADISDRWAALIRPFSRASFGIYLIHVIVLVEAGKLPLIGPLYTSGSALYMIPLIGLLAYLISFLAVLILQKIPLVRYTVP